jgi:FkbM family methyltransferase
MTSHHVAARLATAIECLVGRRRTIRMTRFLLNHARRDGPNNIDHNGERVIQQTVLDANDDRGLVVFDVGANVGQWSSRLLGECRSPISLHVFEPARASADELRANLAGSGDVRIDINQLALSSRAGTATLFQPHERAGSSSLHQVFVVPSGLMREEVTTTTVDAYCAAHQIDHIDLLKVDAEGHDHHVLLGARQMLARQAIDIVQFEYNHRWIGARHYLGDAFELVEPYGYTIGKVTPAGVEWYQRWVPQLETFIEGNYVAAQSDVRRRLPSATWWPEERR